MKVRGCIRCECAVLAELDSLRRMGDAIISYVGVSKPSCSACSEYFAAYRKVTQQDMQTTRGTHDQVYPWRCPTLANDVADRKIRTELSDRLRSLLVAEVVRFVNKRRLSTSSVTSLSTTAPEDEIADNSPVLSGASFTIHSCPQFA